MERLGATNPMSTFATAETNLELDDFGLHTMDTYSDLMSMEGETIPTVFNGFKLNSYKEQKISYDLDRLSRILNVNELNSTSGSDISDALANTQTSEEDMRNISKLASKINSQKVMSETKAGGLTDSFCHESQDTVVEVSSNTKDSSSPKTSSSVCFENSNFSHDQTNNSVHSVNSVNSSPIYGINNAGESQRSSRSSPKSLKNGVHFASFVTEYINTSASQSFESTTIVTKKLPSDQSPGKGSVNIDTLVTDGVLPIIGDPTAQTKKTAPIDATVGMLSKVSLNQDSDSSPCTPPSDLRNCMPFEGYNQIESSSRFDKENEGISKVYPPQRHDHPSIHKHQSEVSSLPTDASDNLHLNTSEHLEHNNNVSNLKEIDKIKKSQNTQNAGRSLPANPNVESTNVGGQNLSDPKLIRSSHSAEDNRLVETERGDETAGQISTTESTGSNKSNPLNLASESSSSTIRDDFSVKDNTSLEMNIVESTSGQEKTSQKTSHSEQAKPDNVKKSEEKYNSPKKLNIDPTEHAQANETETNTTPLRRLVRSGSYTLKEPSPALLKARSRLQEEDRKRESVVFSDKSDKKENAFESSQKSQIELSPESNFPHPEKNPVNTSVTQETEREGKAEHINKYLNQVQFQNSMNFSHQSLNILPSEVDESVPLEENLSDIDVDSSVVELVQSLSESGHEVDVLQLTKLHQLRMEQAKREMIERQELEMEELFVQQVSTLAIIIIVN